MEGTRTVGADFDQVAGMITLGSLEQLIPRLDDGVYDLSDTFLVGVGAQFGIRYAGGSGGGKVRYPTTLEISR